MPYPVIPDVPQSNTAISDASTTTQKETVNADGSQLVSLVDGKKATYTAVATGLATLGSAGILYTLTGSATKTVRILRVEINGIATSATTLEFVLNKYSTAATGGTAGTAPTVVPFDSADAVGTATPAIYTAAPTAGTLVGAVRAAKVNLGTSAAIGQNMVWEFGNLPGQKALVLRGVAQQIGITTSATAAGSSVDIAIIYTEE